MSDGNAAYVNDFQIRVIGVSNDSPTTLEYDYGNNDDAFGAFSSNVAGTPLSGARAFLRINNLPGIAAEPYRLYAVVQPPLAAASLEREPNDTPAQANRAGNNYFYGALAGPAPSSDVDVYAFSVAGAGELIFLSLDCHSPRGQTPIHRQLGLLDASRNVVLKV